MAQRELPTGSANRWKVYRQRDWPIELREYDSGTPAGRERLAQFEEYKAMAADRQARALLAATWVLALATVGLLVATAVLAYITATHTGHLDPNTTALVAVNEAWRIRNVPDNVDGSILPRRLVSAAL